MASTIASSVPPALPDSFRAYVIENFGDTLKEVKLRTNVPHAPLSPTQVRIKVHAAALNPVDYKMIEFGNLFMSETPSAENPFRLGFDVAGMLVEVGSDVDRGNLKVGDAVVAQASFGLTGSFADYFVLDAKYVVPKPTNLSFTQAAGLPLAGQTSYQALVQYGKLKKGDRMLILGGSSGTGGIAIQIAKALGASFVAATTSTRNTELVKSFGADQVIDYTKEKWGDVLDSHSIDLIYDCGVEPLSWNDAAQRVLKKDTGRFVTLETIQTPIESPIGATLTNMVVQSSAVDLKKLTQLVEDGKIVPTIDSVYPFGDLLGAITKVKSSRARGKVVVQIA